MSDGPNPSTTRWASYGAAPPAGGREAGAAGDVDPGEGQLILPAGRVFRFGREPEAAGTGPDSSPNRGGQEIATEEWQPLFGTGADSSTVMMAARGKGQYVVVADPHPASNLGLASAENLRLMEPGVPGRTGRAASCSTRRTGANGSGLHRLRPGRDDAGVDLRRFRDLATRRTA